MQGKSLIIAAALLFIGGANYPVYAHQCQLTGNDAQSISQYNQCKADLMITGMHPPEKLSEAQPEAQPEDSDSLSALKAENKQLRWQLDMIKNHLFEILKDL